MSYTLKAARYLNRHFIMSFFMHSDVREQCFALKVAFEGASSSVMSRPYSIL